MRSGVSKSKPPDNTATQVCAPPENQRDIEVLSRRVSRHRTLPHVRANNGLMLSIAQSWSNSIDIDDNEQVNQRVQKKGVIAMTGNLCAFGYAHAFASLQYESLGVVRVLTFFATDNLTKPLVNTRFKPTKATSITPSASHAFIPHPNLLQG